MLINVSNWSCDHSLIGESLPDTCRQRHPEHLTAEGGTEQAAELGTPVR